MMEISSTVNAAGTNELPFDPNMPALEDIGTFDFSNEDENNVSPTPTTRIHKDHPLDQVIGDLRSAPKTRDMSKNLEEHRKELCNAFEKLMHEKFQMSSIGELTFFLGLQVKQKNDGIFISQDKYVAEILKKFGFTEVKNASTPMETQKPLLKDEDGEEVDYHMYRKPKRKNTQVPQPSGSIEHVVDEVVHKERGDRLVRAATTASSLEVEQDIGNINKTQSKAIHNEASSLGTTSGGGPRRQEAMGDTIAQTRFENVSKLSNDSLLARALEKTNTTQALEITSLKRRVKKLEKKQRSRTHKLKRLYKFGLTARMDSSEDEPNLGKYASKQRRIEAINADEDITLVNDQDDANDAKMFDVYHLHGEEVFFEKDDVNNEVNDEVHKVFDEVVEDTITTKLIIDDAHVNVAGELNASCIATTDSVAATVTTKKVTLAKGLAELKALKPKVKGVFIQEPSESITTTTTISSKKSQDKGKGIMVEEHVKPKKKDQIRLDEEPALKLQVALKAKKRRKFFAAKREEEKRNKPPTQAQQRKIMCSYLKNTEGNKLKDLKKKSFDFIQKIFDKSFKRVNTFEPISSELVKGSSKRVGEEIEQERSKKQKVDDDKETTKLKKLMEIIPNEKEVAIDSIPLAVKSPKIVD
nr:ribonuclease H-like domain-containing protein [Tanacetum cinerariifolium]